jgi:hypothetical protein
MNPALLLIPLYAFVMFCLVDIFTAEQVRRLPRWAWAVISLNALGGVIYPLVGRVRGKHEYQRGHQTATSTLTDAARSRRLRPVVFYSDRPVRARISGGAARLMRGTRARGAALALSGRYDREPGRTRHLVSADRVLVPQR